MPSDYPPAVYCYSIGFSLKEQFIGDAGNKEIEKKHLLLLIKTDCTTYSVDSELGKTLSEASEQYKTEKQKLYKRNNSNSTSVELTFKFYPNLKLFQERYQKSNPNV